MTKVNDIHLDDLSIIIKEISEKIEEGYVEGYVNHPVSGYLHAEDNYFWKKEETDDEMRIIIRNISR